MEVSDIYLGARVKLIGTDRTGLLNGTATMDPNGLKLGVSWDHGPENSTTEDAADLKPFSP